jgi:hypothetical protein
VLEEKKWEALTVRAPLRLLDHSLPRRTKRSLWTVVRSKYVLAAYNVSESELHVKSRRNLMKRSFSKKMKRNEWLFSIQTSSRNGLSLLRIARVVSLAFQTMLSRH